MYNPEENELLHELDEVRQELRRTKKALELACERINNDNSVLKTFGFSVEAYYLRKAEEQLNFKIERDEEW